MFQVVDRAAAGERYDDRMVQQLPVSGPTGRDRIAQGNALGENALCGVQALKGRDSVQP
jgi:hypothetical protein